MKRTSDHEVRSSASAEPHSATKPCIPEEPCDVLYQIVASRRLGYDSMMWQAPFLSLTAQAFLLTIALSPETRAAGRIISAALGVLAAVASIQLMLKHRSNEVADSRWLEDYEAKHFKCQPVHAHPKERPYAKLNWVTRVPSTFVWIGGLTAFGLAALLTLLITLVEPACLAK